MEVRRLGANDSELAFEALRLLKNPYGCAPGATDHLARWLGRSENVLIVATMSGSPAGFLIAHLLDRVDGSQPMMLLYEIGVAESQRRRGIGKQMIVQLKSIGRAQNVMKVWALTARSNVAATRLYASTGATAAMSGDEVIYTYAGATLAPDALE